MKHPRTPQTGARQQRRLDRRTAAATMALLLSACGGGGSPGVSGPVPVFVDGSVVKGPVAAARVCATWIVSGSPESATETCTSTTADGRYSLQMPRRTGVLAVTATGGNWRNEATGAATVLGTLRTAVLFDGASNNLAAQVTALTEVMVRRAEARGRVDEASVQAATAEVARTFGVSTRTLVASRPADVTGREAHLSGTPELQYGLANAGVTGWMVERGIASLDDALTRLSSGIGAGTLYEELASFRAGIRRVITSNPSSGLSAQASAWASIVPLDFGSPPPEPPRPSIVEQPGTLRFAARWLLDDVLGRPVGVVCVTNVPPDVPTTLVLDALQAHAATYGSTITAAGLLPVARCIGGGQSITIDWSRTSADPWGTAYWGDEG